MAGDGGGVAPLRASPFPPGDGSEALRRWGVMGARRAGPRGWRLFGAVLFPGLPAKAARVLALSLALMAISLAMLAGVWLTRWVAPWYLGVQIPDYLIRHAQHTAAVTCIGCVVTLAAVVLQMAMQSEDQPDERGWEV